MKSLCLKLAVAIAAIGLLTIEADAGPLGRLRHRRAVRHCQTFEPPIAFTTVKTVTAVPLYQTMPQKPKVNGEPFGTGTVRQALVNNDGRPALVFYREFSDGSWHYCVECNEKQFPNGKPAGVPEVVASPYAPLPIAKPATAIAKPAENAVKGDDAKTPEKTEGAIANTPKPAATPTVAPVTYFVASPPPRVAYKFRGFYRR